MGGMRLLSFGPCVDLLGGSFGGHFSMQLHLSLPCPRNITYRCFARGMTSSAARAMRASSMPRASAMGAMW
eukprot:1955614-Lingulodinium_polyedra.AAC.1